jgi:hypothetical protein
MPTQEINAAIAALEAQLRHHEILLEQAIDKNEILAKTKIILRKLREISRELNELKKIKAENN